jgi:SAM-dependent methyltransferase
VHGALDEQSYANAGSVVAASIAAYLERQCGPLDDLDVLDFACGPGRIATQFKKLAPSCRLHGTDIDEAAVDWAHSHLSAVATFEVNSLLPPTRYENGSFDVIYAVSFFTHLDEQSQLAWLAEFSRIAKPGATLLATVHGESTHHSCFPDELRQLETLGFVYRIDRKGKFKLDGLPDSYQTTFHTRAYITDVWSRSFEIVDYIAGGLHGHQDVVILKRRPAASSIPADTPRSGSRRGNTAEPFLL